MKTNPMIILDEHPNWLQPLYGVLKERGVEAQKLDLSSASYEPEESSIYSFYVNRLSPSAGKRGHENAFAYALNYILYLEGRGARVVNGSKTVMMETSKALQSSLLFKLGIPQPKTIVVNTTAQLLNNLDRVTFPIVIKPNIGGSGAGIQKFFSAKEVINIISQQKITSSLDNLLLLQEFIQPKEGYIVRVETIAGKVVYAMKVFTNDTFNLCPSDSCDMDRRKKVDSESMGYCVADSSKNVRFELYENPPKYIVSAVEKLVQEAGLEVGGIEYVINERNEWFVYDINALSILRSSFKEEYGIDGWEMLADYFIQEYRKVVA